MRVFLLGAEVAYEIEMDSVPRVGDDIDIHDGSRDEEGIVSRVVWNVDIGERPPVVEVHIAPHGDE